MTAGTSACLKSQPGKADLLRGEVDGGAWRYALESGGRIDLAVLGVLYGSGQVGFELRQVDAVCF